MSEDAVRVALPWWTDIFSLCRPGTRIVLDHPEDSEIVKEFARRGYRLHVLHDASFDLPGLRQGLRDLGLASQLMGSSAVTPHTEPKLTRNFYEGWVVCSSGRPVAPQTLFDTLQPGSCIYGRTEECWFSSLGSPRERVPPDITVRRLEADDKKQ